MARAMHEHNQNLDNYVPDAQIADRKWSPNSPNNTKVQRKYHNIKSY